MRVLRDFTEQQIAVLKATTLAVVPWPDRVLGEALGVSAEQAGQVRARVHDQLGPGLKHVDDLAELVVKVCGRPVARHQVVAFLSAADVPLPLDEEGAEPVAHYGAPASAAASPEELASRLLWQRLEGLLVREVNQIWVTPEVAARCSTLSELAEARSDHYGLVSEFTLVDSFPPDVAVEWIRLRQLCALRRISGWVVTAWGLENTSASSGVRPLRRSTAVALALNDIGRPATTEEIEETLADLGLDHNFPLRTVASKMRDVVRASKTRWGFAQWVDEVYDSIGRAIDRRIEAGGGEANLDHVAEEISAKFDVLAKSVRAKARTRRYMIVDGSIRWTDFGLADESQPNFVRLDEFVQASWRHGGPSWSFAGGSEPVSAWIATSWRHGGPFWSFTVEPHHLVRDLQLELRLATTAQLGRRPGPTARVHVRTPRGADPAHLIWPTQGGTGGGIVGLADALARIGALPGDQAEIEFHRGLEVSIWRQPPLAGSAGVPARLGPRPHGPETSLALELPDEEINQAVPWALDPSQFRLKYLQPVAAEPA